MPINLDLMTEAELRDLNRRIVERLRFLTNCHGGSRHTLDDERHYGCAVARGRRL